jgi:hypothetical protein
MTSLIKEFDFVIPWLCVRINGLVEESHHVILSYSFISCVVFLDLMSAASIVNMPDIL